MMSLRAAELVEVIKTIDRLMSVPGAVDVGEFEDGRVKFIGIKIDDTTPFAGVRLAELPGKTEGRRPLIAAILRDDQLIIPMGEDQLLKGDLVYFVSQEEHVSKTLNLFNKHAEPIELVLIPFLLQVIVTLLICSGLRYFH